MIYIMNEKIITFHNVQDLILEFRRSVPYNIKFPFFDLFITKFKLIYFCLRPKKYNS